MSASSSDAFLKKTDEELLYLVEHPEFYHSALIMAATQELRRRGATLPAPAPPPSPAPLPLDYEEPEPSMLRRWLPAALALLVLGLTGWLILRNTSGNTSAATPAKPAAPIVLESVKAQPLPNFEASTKTYVQELRRQLPAADRADTTATGRYLRMARRYFLAESQAAHLAGIAKRAEAAGTFPGQIDLTQERISWFMRAKAYNQHLHPIMEERLALMQQGLTLRQAMLHNFKYRFENELPMMDRDMSRADFEATDISAELRGKPRQRTPIQGRLSDI
jgi:hypothetical protein